MADIFGGPAISAGKSRRGGHPGRASKHNYPTADVGGNYKFDCYSPGRNMKWIPGEVASPGRTSKPNNNFSSV